MRAYALITTKPGTSEEVVKRIKKNVKEAIQVDTVYGRFDVIVVVETSSIDDINQILYKVIEKDPNIIHTETSLVMST